MANVWNPKTGKWTQVKNLGWLLRNWKDVSSFNVQAYNPPAQLPQPEGVMHATMKDGRVYQTEWASLAVCNEWLDRPVFRGLPLNWCGMEIKCGTRLTFGRK